MTITIRPEGRLILLGVDSLDLPLARRFAQSGAMPNFARLLDTSPVVSLTEHSISPLPTVTWINLMTGVSPGVHGFADPAQLQRAVPRNGSDTPAPFYKTLSDRGIRCALVDVPLAMPLRPFNGIQVLDWGAQRRLWGFDTEPRSQRRRLLDTYGRHPLGKTLAVQRDKAGLRKLRATLAQGLKQKARLVDDLLAGPYEFLFLNYAELTKAGQNFWRFYDPAHPDHDSSDPQLAGALPQLHRLLDQAIGEVLEDLDDTDNLMIISDRGLQANHRGHQMMEEALVRMGFMARLGAPADPGQRTGRWLRRNGIRRLGRRLLPSRVRRSLKPWYRRTIGEPPPVDESRSQVFFEAGLSNSYLRVNLAGREPNGIVHPAEYTRLLRRIQHELYALVNPATGTPVVNKVYYPQRMYPGGQSDSLPDVSIDWSAQHRVDAIQSPTIGVVEQPFTDPRSGNHRSDAFLLCHGPGFLNRPVQVKADARQLAPTVFCLLGEPAPRHYQLGPLSEALRIGQVVPFEPQRRRAI